MTRVHFVRHGETIWHAENRYAGVSDIALTDRGMQQAQWLAPWLASMAPDRILCSPLSRAVATATPAAVATGLTLEVDDRLREVDFGAAEGMTSAEMEATFAVDRERFLRSPATSPLPGGETGVAAVERAVPVIESLEGTVVIVAHTTLIRLVLCWAIGLPLDDYRRTFPRLDNIAVTTITLPPDRPLAGRCSLLALNVPVREPPTLER